MRRHGTLLRPCELALASCVRTQRRDDQPFTVRRNVELGLWRNAEQLKDGLVDDDARTVPDRLEALDLDVNNTVGNERQESLRIGQTGRASRNLRVRQTYQSGVGLDGAP